MVTFLVNYLKLAFCIFRFLRKQLKSYDSMGTNRSCQKLLFKCNGKFKHD